MSEDPKEKKLRVSILNVENGVLRSIGKHLLPVHVNAVKTRLRKAIEGNEDLTAVRRDLIKKLKDLLREPKEKVKIEELQTENVHDRDEAVEPPMTRLFHDLTKEEKMELAINGDIYFGEGTLEHVSICEIRIAENL